MDNLRIDSHKLLYHPKRVAQWLNEENVYPLYFEIGPSGRCNHRCIFCAFDYLKYQGPFIEKGALASFLSESATVGVKSVLYSGEGEPLLHQDIAEIILQTEKFGIYVALSTNGVLFNNSLARQTLGSLTWIRFSLDAATKETHGKIHRCPEGDFGLIIKNLSDAVKIKRQNNYACTIGVQFILLPENHHEAIKLAAMTGDMGVDYLTIKPFYRRPMSYHTPDRDFHYTDLLALDDDLQKLASDQFKVIFRARAMEKLEDEKKEYEQCLGLPFAAHIDAKGDMYTCSAFVGDKNFCYGNICQSSFSEIWEGEKRKDVLLRVAEMDISQCHRNCRLDEINTYLWSLRHTEQIPHGNFI